MRRCDKCGCLCDPGDLVNGVCDDCREAEKKREKNQEMTLRMMQGEARQMELKEFMN